eukprot:3869555-Lingulodinium_polyedra.AAC.1
MRNGSMDGWMDGWMAHGKRQRWCMDTHMQYSLCISTHAYHHHVNVNPHVIALSGHACIAVLPCA